MSEEIEKMDLFHYRRYLDNQLKAFRTFFRHNSSNVTGFYFTLKSSILKMNEFDVEKVNHDLPIIKESIPILEEKINKLKN